MALFTDDIITRFIGDTTALEKSSLRAGIILDQFGRDASTAFREADRDISNSEKQFSRSSISMARNSLGLLQSMQMAARGGGNLSHAIGAVTFDISQLSQSMGQLGGKWSSVMAVVGQAGPWIALAAAVASTGFAIANVALNADRARQAMITMRETQPLFFREFEERQRGVRATGLQFAGPAVTIPGMPAGEILTPAQREARRRAAAAAAAAEDLGFAREVSEEEIRATRGGRARLDAKARATALREQFSEQQRMVRDAEMAAFDERKAIQEQQGREMVEGFRKTLADMGIDDPKLGLASLWIGDTSAIRARLAQFDIEAAQIEASIKRIGAVASASAKGGLSSFFSTLFAGRGAAAAFRAMTASIVQSLGVEAAVQTLVELAKGFAALARGNGASAAGHFKSSAIWGGAAAMAGAVAGGLAGGGGGGGGIGSGGGRGGGRGIEPIGGGGTTAGGVPAEPQPIIIKVEVPPGGEVVAGQGVLSVIEAYERERGFRIFARS